MGTNRPIWILSLLVALSTPTAGGFPISVEGAESFDLARYHTYTWTRGTPAHSETAQGWILAAVTREMDALGLQVDESAAGLHVASHVLVGRRTLEELADPVQWEFLTGITSTRPRDLGAGTLVIDLVDASSGERVWRGIGTAKVQGPVNDKMGRKIEKIVRKLFKKLSGSP